MKHRYQPWLVPYAEGTLDERRRAKLEARLARDPALAAEAEATRRTVGRLRDASGDENSEAAPGSPAPSVWPQIEARLRPARRAAPRPWFWAGGLCAAASLAWATLWGPLTSHTAMSVRSAPPSQAVAEKPPAVGILPSGTGSVKHPRKPTRGSVKALKHPARVKNAAPSSRPTPHDLLAARAAPTGAVSPAVPDATADSPGRFRLTSGVRDLSKRSPEPSDQEGTADKPTTDQAPPAADDPAATNANGSSDSVQGQSPAIRAGRRKPHHRRHRRHHSGGQFGPAQAAPALPPDTVPQADPVPPALKHRPDID